MPEYVFACSGNRPGGGLSGDNAFVVINIDDLTNPTLVTALIDAVNLSDPIHMVVGSGRDYAYVCAFGNDTFTIIDISNPLAPAVVGTCALPGAYDVAISGNYAFVTGSWDRNFHSVDISDPTNPFIEDTIATTWDIHGVKVEGDYAYVGENSGLYIFNISDPTNIVQESYTPDVGGNLWRGYDLLVEAPLVYYCAMNCFTILDCTLVGAPAILDTYVNGVDLPVPQLNGLYGIDKVRDLVYLAAGGGYYFTVLNVANPAAIATAGVLWINTIFGANVPRPQHVFVRNAIAYVNMGNTGNNTNHGLHILNVANPAAMALLGSLAGGGAPNYLDQAMGGGALLPPTIRGNPNIDQRIYQHVERMDR